MKVYISADIEGITGLVSWSQCGRPDSDHFDYRWARERMTADVNAAIRGAKAGGATQIVVKDSHGNSKNLLIDQLEPGTRLVSGHGATQLGMMAGINRTYAAALLVGYHARAGTLGGVMEHTITGFIHRLWVNGQEMGEIGLSAGVAGCFDVPIVMISSDEAGCREASELLEGIVTAPVKTGYGRYMAECLHPSETEELIFEAAKTGVEKASALDPFLPDTPTTLVIEMNRSEEADMAAKLLGVRRKDGYTIEFQGDTWSEVHAMAWSILTMGIQGQDSGK